jgi:phosphoglycolate phosphatase
MILFLEGNMNYKRLIFLDLDETLLDTSERHYQVYCDIIDELNLHIPLDKNEFWKLKRNGISTVEILEEIDPEILLEFSKLWIKKIESKNYLIYDKLFKDSLGLLSKLSQEKLILVTMRNNRENLIWELKKLGLYNKFNTILSCSPLNNTDKSVPIQEFINENQFILDKNSIIVGDSETDIITGKKLNITVIAVSYGIRNLEKLIPFNPEFCLRSINEIVETIDMITNIRI